MENGKQIYKLGNWYFIIIEFIYNIKYSNFLRKLIFYNILYNFESLTSFFIKSIIENIINLLLFL